MSKVQLNTEQLEAIKYIDGPILVLAGAGTGKTTVLVERVKYLLENNHCKPENILATTFTTKATEEMRIRLSMNNSKAPEWIGTFHALCGKIVRMYAAKLDLDPNFKIVDGEQQKAIAKKLFGLQEAEVMDQIQFWKNQCKKPSDIAQINPHKKDYIRYQAALREENALDFSDLIIECCYLWQNFPEILEAFRNQFTFLCIDEFQDTNHAQFLWLNLLTDHDHKVKLFCVGDDDQAIYAWRGSDNQYILNFHQKYKNAKLVKLQQNYRSTGHILNAALSIVSKNKQRLGKMLFSNKGDGDKVYIKSFLDDTHETQWLINNLNKEKGTVAILVRTGWQLTELSRMLHNNGLLGTKNNIILMKYLEFLLHPTFERCAFLLQNPKRGIGEKTIEKFEKICQIYADKGEDINLHRIEELLLEICNKEPQRSGVNLFFEQIDKWLELAKDNKLTDLIVDIWQTLQLSAILPGNLLTKSKEYSTLKDFVSNYSQPEISLLTIHAAKGLEFDSVYLPGWEENVFPHARALVSFELEEERRLAYVAITRGRTSVYITYAMVRRSPRGFLKKGPSRFISDIPSNHCIF